MVLIFKVKKKRFSYRISKKYYIYEDIYCLKEIFIIFIKEYRYLLWNIYIFLEYRYLLRNIYIYGIFFFDFRYLLKC